MTRLNRLLLGLVTTLYCIAVPAFNTQLLPSDEVGAFKAAGFKLSSNQWRSDCDDPGTASYTPGRIVLVRDINDDGHPEAVITEGSTYCYGNTGTGYRLVSKRPDGSWRLISSGTGILNFQTTKGVGGWPDIEIGGPGFCFPVLRWNGLKYVLLRHQYEGKSCEPK